MALLILVAGLAVGGCRHGADHSAKAPLLGRPLRVGIVTWPGYCGGIVANNSFKPNRESIYFRSHGLLVEFMLLEDLDVRSKLFAQGGADGVDIIWSTVDFWAKELPGLLKSGVRARAIMQVSWSRGGDAIVADKSIQRVEDLKGKKISLALFTSSHWLLESSLRNSSLDELDQAQIVKTLVGKSESSDPRTVFVSGQVDAAVVWEPDVTEALSKRPNSHVLVSTRTAANLIADVMVAREAFIQEHPDVIRAFIRGWLDGTVEANRRNDLAARLLMDNEPFFKEVGEKVTREGLQAVKWADLTDNVKMFGLDGSEPLFDRIFRQASQTWVKRGYIAQAVSPADAKDDRILKQIYQDISPLARPKAVPDEFINGKTPPAQVTRQPIMSWPANIFFATASAALDPNAELMLDQIALIAQTFSNAFIRVEGNTDNVGDRGRNVTLSQLRAQAVVDYLVRRYNLSAARFLPKGNGPDRPIADNGTRDGRTKNRRTDIMVVPRS